MSFTGLPSNGTWSGTHINSSGDFNPTVVGSFDNIYTFTDANGCVNSDTMTITVINPTNANAGNGFDVCVDTGSILLTGTPPNGIWSGNNIDPNGTYNVNIDGSFDFTYSFGTGNCLTSDSVTIIVNPLPNVSAGNDLAFCIDAGIQNLSGSPSNGTWSGSAISINGDFNPASAGIGTHTVYYSFVDTNTCENIDSALITVNPLPIVNAGNDTTLCNQPGAVSFTGLPSNGTWSGTHINSSGDFNPTVVGSFDNIYTFTDANGCVNSDTMTITVINPTNANAGSGFDVCVDTGSILLTGTPPNGIWSGNNIDPNGTYNVNIDGSFDFIYSFGTGNCLTSDSVTIIVNPLPNVSAGNDLAFCIDAGIQNLSGSPSNGTWSGSAISINGDFNPASAGIGTHTVYYSFVDTNTCENIDSALITVNPLPIVNAGNDTTLCNQPGAVSFTGLPSNGTWSGTHINSSGDFNPTVVGSFDNIYTFTDANGCVNSDTMTITVINPTNANAGNGFDVCVDTGSILLTGTPPNGIWSGNNIDPNGTYNVNIDGSFDFIYSFGTGNCLTSDSVTIIVNPLPNVSAGNDLAFCIDAGIQNLSGSPSNGTWSGSAISINGDFNPASAGVGTHTVYYSFVDTNTCENIDSALITVNPLPIVNAGNDTTLCNQPGAVSFTGLPSNGTWIWTGLHMSSNGGFSPNGIGAFDNIYTFTDVNGCLNSDTMTITVINPTNANAGNGFDVCVDTGSILLTGTPPNGIWSGNNIDPNGTYNVNIDGSFDFIYSFGTGNCLTSDSVTIIVNPLPNVSAGNDLAFCIDAGIQNLSGSPSNGTWSGSAISINGDFNPASAGIGTHTVYYSFVDTNTCENIDSALITVNPLPIVNAGNDTTLCNQPGAVSFTGLPSNGTWIWTGLHMSSNGGFSPNGIGAFDNIYTFTDANGCVNSDTVSISVVNPIYANAGDDFEACVDTGSIFLTGTPPNGIWSGNNIDPNGTYNVNIDGSFDFIYSYGTGNCLTSDSVTIIINLSLLLIADLISLFVFLILTLHLMPHLMVVFGTTLIL